MTQALHGGEEYELLFTVRTGTRVPERFEGLPLTRIGLRHARGRPDGAYCTGASLFRAARITIIFAASIAAVNLEGIANMRVTVIGTGYVGTVTGACLAYLGHRVTCVDTDPVEDRKAAPAAQSPIYEPGLEELIVLAGERGGIDFETDLDGPGPRKRRHFHRGGNAAAAVGESNLAYLEAAARGIGAAMDGSRFRVVVNKSTVPVG